jgi:hypothetical protein
MSDLVAFLHNHRGPYRFCLTRDKGNTVSARTRFSTEWLPGEVDRDDVQAEAQALLTDPRDTIIGVNFWSVSENQFVGSLRKG